MNRSSRAKAVRRAFTLLEVLMVIVILGVLAALIVPQFTGTQRRAEEDLTKSQIASVSNTLETFRLRLRAAIRPPMKGLAVLLEKPDDDEVAEKWAGPYVKQVPQGCLGPGSALRMSG